MFEKSKQFTRRIETLIPGGAHTYSKGRDQFPEESGSGIVRGEGAWVWDADGNRLIDWGMALMSVSLGHGHPEVVEAVSSAIKDGVSFSRPSQIELDTAQLWVDMTGDEMVKFARHGSCVTTGAVKLARAFTGRPLVLLPAEHPFFSFDDWFIGATPSDFGIPDQFKTLTRKFHYNDLVGLEELVDQHHGEVACIIMEPVKFDEPVPGFLEGVRELCNREDIILIFDEMQSGLKMGMPGASSYFGVKGDLTTWGKGIGNGFGIAALTGRREIMELGGIDRTGERKMFLLSSTHGAETVGLSAMQKTLEVFRRDNVVEKNWSVGREFKLKLQKIINDKGLNKYIQIKGYPCYLSMDFSDCDGKADNAYRTLFMQEMFRHGVLFQGLFFFTPSHVQDVLDQSLYAFERSCEIYADAISKRSVAGLLTGDSIQPVFRKYV